ncbi:glycosyltransferase [Variovorax sp. dw_308]|uniref:glycosyltransferase n=1 Tax=Variovorax sp. dw_308 TaxID=2721546 RepID=UPI001C4768C1|nr:glycosyltransferase [Variovorax sp. dw_308]
MKYDHLGECAQASQSLLDEFDYDVFVDLSACGLDAAQVSQHLLRLQRDGGYDHVSTQLSVALPAKANAGAQNVQLAHAGTNGSLAFARSAELATSRRKHLLIILGTIVPANEVVASLVSVFGVDPLIGSVQPRLADAATDDVWPLFHSPTSKHKPVLVSRGALFHLPPVLLAAEALGPCMLVRREVVASLEVMPEYASARGAILHALCQARRRGFRTAIFQRAVVSVSADDNEGDPETALFGPISKEDASRLLEHYPDHARAKMENEGQPMRRLEALLGAAFPRAGAPRRLLLDCRGMGAMHNGTSQCVLGILGGLSELNDPRWAIDVWSRAPAAAFHELPRLFPNLRHVHGHPSDVYAAVLVPNQPWGLATVSELHGLARAMVFNMLDTIAWDVIYPSDERVEPCWRYISRHADGLAYISSYTQDRFRRRFPVASRVEERVVHLSLSREENSMPCFAGAPRAEHILVFGNSYDHKDLAPTLKVLCDAFPLQDLVVLGGAAKAPHVRVIPSGRASNEEIHQLVATARAIVYPSYYEGFGLPVVESLAYGRPVLVRKSALWNEIAANVRLPGLLIEFDDPLSLVERLGRLLAGLPVPTLSQATELPVSEAAHGWKQCAAGLVELVEKSLANPDTENWLERDLTLGMARL